MHDMATITAARPAQSIDRTISGTRLWTLGSFCAYAMGRMKFRGRTVIMYLILSMTMFPQIAILGSLFQMISRVHLYDRLPALIISYLTFTLPFTVWVLANFFKALPGEL